MRQVLLIIGALIFVVSLIIGFSAFVQVNREQIELTARLQSRSQVLADSLSESIGPSYTSGATSTVQRLIEKFVSNERLAGLGVFDNSGVAVAASENLPLIDDERFITDVMDTDESHGDFVHSTGVAYYVQVTPLHDDSNRVVGALAVAQDATYIDESIRSIWFNSLVRFFTQIFIFSVAIYVLFRWVFFRSVSELVESLQAIRMGGTIDEVRGAGFLAPLAGEISKVTKSLRQARFAASEEARMRLEKLDTPWTAGRLREFIKASLKDRPIYVLTNREPYVHTKVKDKIEWSVPASGVISALESVMEACGGMWIAHGSGTADKETADTDGKIRVPPDEPKYTLKRISLTEEELKGYYTGFSNEALWPLCLMAHTRPIFRASDWTAYKKVNALFATTLLEEIRHVDRPIVLIQDYHLSLVPAIIKKSRPDALVAMFWHIPWPSAAQFNICPRRTEILEGMLGADLVGFQTQQHCNNFIETVGNEIESRIDYEQFTIYRNAHKSVIKPFPISIAYPGSAESHGEARPEILSAFGIDPGSRLILGVDRLDYTKGIPEKFKAFEFLLSEHKKYRGNLTLLQIASPTRESVEKYREYAAHVTREADRINERFGTKNWKPIVLEKRHYTHEQIGRLYKLADVCLISSLHDGMNLVAKEFAAARSDEAGVLVLSEFAGASRDLKGALLINPYSAEESSTALHEALQMPPSEQHRRMKSLRASVRDYNIYRWSAELIKSLSQLE